MYEKEIHRYNNLNLVTSLLDPLEDVKCWVKGLTSTKYVEELLESRHTLAGSASVRERSNIIARFVNLGCKYLEQAEKGPPEISFLPLYYALLNLSKAYITAGPCWTEISKNRKHGASYDPETNARTLDNDSIKLHPQGVIPLLYKTLVGEDMFNNGKSRLILRMKDIYPYIFNISAEYKMATGNDSKLIPFRIGITKRGDNKRRITAEVIEGDKTALEKIDIKHLQGFNSLYREGQNKHLLVSDWCEEGNTDSLMSYLRRATFYGYLLPPQTVIQFIPVCSKRKPLMPEELPLLCAFYHMSNVVRYKPEMLATLMDSKYLPVLLALRRHGIYRFLLLFWSFFNQCCTYITPP